MFAMAFGLRMNVLATLMSHISGDRPLSSLECSNGTHNAHNLRQERMSAHKDILVADDSNNDFTLLMAAFAAAGLRHNFHRVHDGAEATAYLNAESPFSDRTTCPFPDLLLLAFQMPKAGAIDVLRFLRKRPNLKVPTIVLTGSMSPGTIEKALELGAVECVAKPATLQALIGAVQTIHRRWLEN
jgi:two-component system response regulator